MAEKIKRIEALEGPLERSLGALGPSLELESIQLAYVLRQRGKY